MGTGSAIKLEKFQSTGQNPRKEKELLPKTTKKLRKTVDKVSRHPSESPADRDKQLEKPLPNVTNMSPKYHPKPLKMTPRGPPRADVEKVTYFRGSGGSLGQPKGRPGDSQETPESPQREPKASPRHPKASQGRSKTPPKQPQERKTRKT